MLPAAATAATRFTPDRWAAGACLAAAVGYRLWATSVPIPALGGDESVVGIMALHIAAGSDFPVFFYGQHYMAAVEAYLAAPLVALLGPTMAALRLGNVALFAGFLAAMYSTTRRLFTPWFAVATVALLAFGSDRVLRQQLQANGGWEEMLFAASVLAALTAALCLPAVVTRRLPAFTLWGLAAGLGVWASLLMLPNLAALSLALAAFRWRELLGRNGLALAAGFVAALLPAIVHNLRLPPGTGTLADALSYNPPTPAEVTALRQVRGTAHALSLATGMCDVQCTWQVHWWAITYPLLLAAAAGVGCAGLYRSLRHAQRPVMRKHQGHIHVTTDQSPSNGWAAATSGPRHMVRSAMLLALAAGAAGTLVLYLQSIHSGYLTWHTSRYLNNLLLATPAVLWPLWLTATRARRWPTVARPAAAAVLAAIFLTAGSATASVLTDGRAAEQRMQRDHEALLAALTGLGADRLYTDYFTCHRLIYASGERILCVALGPGLGLGTQRWRPYGPQVAAAARPRYVFAAGSPLDREFVAYVEQTAARVDQVTVAGYHVYHADGPLGLPR